MLMRAHRDDRRPHSRIDAQRALIAALTSVLGIVALVLACTGLYGLLAYAVSRHGREIGLRIALGARPSSALWMVQRESLVLAAVGIAAGLAGALALGRFVRTFRCAIRTATVLTGTSEDVPYNERGGRTFRCAIRTATRTRRPA